MLFDVTLCYDDERRTTNAAVPQNGMPYAIKPRQTQPVWRLLQSRKGHKRDRPPRRSQAGNECHMSMGGTPSRRTTTNEIDPFSTAANHGGYGELAVTQATRCTILRATSCRDAVRMRLFDAHYGAIYIAISRDDLLPNRYRMRIHDRQP